MKIHYLMACAMLATGLAGAASAQDRPAPLQPSESWNGFKNGLIAGESVADGSDVLSIDAPYRANDAATVPISFTQTGGARIESAAVVIDENPSPVAAEFDFAPGMGPLSFEMRVRVDQYSNVRVIADSADGQVMVGRFVKASGGCSAPASRNPEEALDNMGEMRLRTFMDDAAINTPRREAQIMIRHPNYSGLQRDQVTQLFVMAHFIDTIEVMQGDEPLWSMEGGISISENPVFRFSYDDNGSTDLTVRATDTEGNTFEAVLPKGATG